MKEEEEEVEKRLGERFLSVGGSGGLEGRGISFPEVQSWRVAPDLTSWPLKLPHEGVQHLATHTYTYTRARTYIHSLTHARAHTHTGLHVHISCCLDLQRHEALATDGGGSGGGGCRRR